MPTKDDKNDPFHESVDYAEPKVRVRGALVQAYLNWLAFMRGERYRK